MEICSKCKIEKPLIEFNKSSNICKSCRKEYNKNYGIKNADKISHQKKGYYLENIERLRQYRIDNADRLKLYDIQYAIDCADKRSKYNSKYIKTEQGKLSRKSNCHKRRVLLKANTIGKHWTPNDIKEILKLQHGKCKYCETSIKECYQIDHFIPITKGGGNEPSNIQLLCKKCNGAGGKWDKMPYEYAQKHGMLV